MRIVVVFTFLIFGTLGGWLLELPAKISEDIVVHWLAEALEHAFGIKLPEFEVVVSKIWLLTPYLASVASLYLYHIIYNSTQISRQYPIALPIENAGHNKTVSLVGGILAFVSLGAFIFSVGLANYQYRPPASSYLKYHSLDSLSNYELRERAFNLTARLTALSVEYSKKEAALSSEFDQKIKEYESTRDNYNAKYNHYSYFLPPTMPFRTDDSTPLTLGPPSFSLPSLETIVRPPPPNEPTRPTVYVDQTWLHEMSELQTEANALWQELYNREGNYPPFLEVPGTYSDQGISNLQYQIKNLENLANRIH